MTAVPAPPPAPAKPVLITWDWREQPPMADIAKAVLDHSRGTVVISQIDTMSDQYMIAIAAHEVDQAQALALLDAEEGLEDEEDDDE